MPSGIIRSGSAPQGLVLLCAPVEIFSATIFASRRVETIETLLSRVRAGAVAAASYGSTEGSQ